VWRKIRHKDIQAWCTSSFYLNYVHASCWRRDGVFIIAVILHRKYVLCANFVHDWLQRFKDNMFYVLQRILSSRAIAVQLPGAQSYETQVEWIVFWTWERSCIIADHTSAVICARICHERIMTNIAWDGVTSNTLSCILNRTRSLRWHTEAVHMSCYTVTLDGWSLWAYITKYLCLVWYNSIYKSAKHSTWWRGQWLGVESS